MTCEASEAGSGFLKQLVRAGAGFRGEVVHSRLHQSVHSRPQT